MRRTFARGLYAVLVACALAGTLAATASATTTPPAEGVFENCDLNAGMTTCLQRLATMHAGGVNVVVLPVTDGSPTDLAAYASFAQAMGMSVMWGTSNPGWWQQPSTSTSVAGSYPGFAADCACDQNGPLLDYMIHFLGALPATYGYYAADDSMLSPGDGPGVSRYSAQIKRDDPTRMIMIGSGDQSQTDGYQHSADLIGAEVYPVTTASLMPVSRNRDSWAGVDQTAIDTQQSANRSGHASAFILQAFTWGDNLADGVAIGVCSPQDTPAGCHSELRYPTAGDQLQLRNEILAHSHPKLILWWSFPGTFGQAVTDTYTIYPFGDVAAGQWHGLSQAIQAPWPTATARSTRRTSVQAHTARLHSAAHRRLTARHHARKRSRHRHRRPARRRATARSRSHRGHHVALWLRRRPAASAW